MTKEEIKKIKKELDALPDPTNRVIELAEEMKITTSELLEMLKI